MVDGSRAEHHVEVVRLEIQVIEVSGHQLEVFDAVHFNLLAGALERRLREVQPDEVPVRQIVHEVHLLLSAAASNGEDPRARSRARANGFHGERLV